MKRVISFWAEVPQSYIDEIKGSRSWRTGRKALYSICLIYIFLHYCFLYVFDPAAYPQLWLRIVDAVQAYVPGAYGWGVSSRLLWDQMPSLHALGFICGVAMCLVVAIYSPCCPKFKRSDGGRVSAKSFLSLTIASIIGLSIFTFWLYGNFREGPYQSLIGVSPASRATLESRFGNLIQFPTLTAFSYTYFGAVIAWMRISISYRYSLIRSIK